MNKIFTRKNSEVRGEKEKRTGDSARPFKNGSQSWLQNVNVRLHTNKKIDVDVSWWPLALKCTVGTSSNFRGG